MNENQPFREPSSYETGSTRPPKSRSGVVAVLLVAVILLCGLSTGLGLMNIRLTLALQEKDPDAGNISFSHTEATDPTKTGTEVQRPLLGIQGKALTELAQRFYRLPPGFWVTDVIAGSPAAKSGLQRGDILLSVNGRAVTDADSIRAVLDSLESGATVQLLLHRAGQKLMAELTLPNVT